MLVLLCEPFENDHISINNNSTCLHRTISSQHVGYGVTPEMYPSVGKALLITFEKGLGEECTPLTTEAWTWVFGIISSICM